MKKILILSAIGLCLSSFASVVLVDDHYQPPKTNEECLIVKDAIPFEIQNLAVLSFENYSQSFEYVKTELVPTSVGFKPGFVSIAVGWHDLRTINTLFDNSITYRYTFSKEVIRPPSALNKETRFRSFKSPFIV